MRRSPRIFACFLTAALWAGVAAAQIAEADRALALDDAFARLAEAPSKDDAAVAEAEVWALWNIGPDMGATVMLSQAAAALRRGMLNEAHVMLDALLSKQPDFMEAWNQRAFAKFLKGDLYASLADIDQVLKREPRHFGALAGRARIEARLGRLTEATRTMGEVGRVHPWMARMSAIPADPPPPEVGERL